MDGRNDLDLREVRDSSDVEVEDCLPKESRQSRTNDRRNSKTQNNRSDGVCPMMNGDHESALRRKASTETSVFSCSIVPSELVLSDCVNSTQDLSKYITKRKKTVRNAIPEIVASCSAASLHIMIGVTFGATASLLSHLEDKDSDMEATKNEIGWVASIFVLVVPVASIFSSFVMETFGRLNAVRLSVIPSIASCILIALSTNVEMLIGGRFLMGIGTALGINPAIVYITEITSPEYRGALVSAGPTLCSLGMMFGYLSGAFLPWRTVSWINIGYCIIPLLVIPILKVPESPPWLISKGRIQPARDSLLWLARKEDESVREKLVDRKLKELMKDREEKLNKSGGQSFWQRWSGLFRPTGYKPLIIMIILFGLQQYSGVYITAFYAVQYFEAAGSSLNPFYASILIGLTRFVFSVVTVFLLKAYGRRPLCMTSCVGMAISMGISGYFTRQVIQTGESSIVPVILIVVYVCFCMIGLLSLPWTMAAEVFPTEIRGLAHGLVIAAAHIIMFVSIKTYYQMAEFFGGHDYLQWFFGLVSVLALIFIYIFLPETHDLTLLEIEDYFRNNSIYPLKNRKKKKRSGRDPGKQSNGPEFDALVEQNTATILPAKNCGSPDVDKTAPEPKELASC